MGEFAIKVSPFGGEYDGGRGAVACGLAEEEMPTTTLPWCKPIVVHESTNSGRPADLYRSLLPPRGGGGHLTILLMTSRLFVGYHCRLNKLFPLGG